MEHGLINGDSNGKVKWGDGNIISRVELGNIVDNLPLMNFASSKPLSMDGFPASYVCLPEGQGNRMGISQLKLLWVVSHPYSPKQMGVVYELLSVS